MGQDFSRRDLPPYPAAIPGAYSVEVQIYRGFWMVTWFKEQFAAHEERRAKERGVERAEDGGVSCGR